MSNQLLNALKTLPLSDKYLLGVAIFILANPKLAYLAAIFIVIYFIWKFSQELKGKF